MNYIKQLDSVRAIAVLLVIITHWFPETNQLNIYTSVFNGVDVFFVLSGFLITRILLQNRLEAESSVVTKSTVVKNFFVRRILRIFPIYYLLIFFLLAFASTTGTDIKNSFPYFLTYTSNIYFYNRQAWDGMLSHLWSLSVEEQFYLFWPWLMLYPKKSWLLPIIILAALVGTVSQMVSPESDILTFACLDGFGAGAFFAWAMVFKPAFLEGSKKVWLLLAIAALGLQLLRVFGPGFSLIPSRTLTAFFTLWVILEIVSPKEKKFFLFNFILNNRVLIFIGKISYGIYLYHLLLPYYTFSAFDRLNALLPNALFRYEFYLVRMENFGLLILISYISWKIIEQPILRLKKHFEYQKPVVQSADNIVRQPSINNLQAKDNI